MTPPPWNVAFLFLNGLPLGMIWGLVFGYMEGRRVSEVLGAVLCASFILSSGVVKSVGAWLLHDRGVSPFWMPAATGALFIPLLLVSVWLLGELPPPNAEDEAERVRRAPMTGAERGAFLRAYLPGIVLLVAAYVLLTAFRDFRDNFAAEIWTALGYGKEAGVFTASEFPVAVISLGALAAVMVVRDNLRALDGDPRHRLPGLRPAGRGDLGVPGPPATGAAVDDPGRRRTLHGLHPVQRHAVRPPDRLQWPGGDRRAS